MRCSSYFAELIRVNLALRLYEISFSQRLGRLVYVKVASGVFIYHLSASEVYMRILSWCVLSVTLWLAACANAPQQVNLQPFIEAPLSAIGRGRALSLEVVDKRSSPTVGYLAAVGGNPPLVVNNVQGPLWQALAERLQGTAQFQVSQQAGAPLALRVELVQLDYQTAGQPVVSEVRAHALIRASIRNGERTLNGQYQSNSARSVLGPPRAVDNEYLLNEAISRALDRMLSDPQVLAALNR